MEYIVIVQPASVRIQEMWQLAKGYNHVSTGLEYPKGGRSELDRDPGGHSRGYNMASLQTFPCHFAGMLAMSSWKRKLFPRV